MRPPAPMTRQWLTEKNSFPVRGLVIYRWPKNKWGCNIELLRISTDDIDVKPLEEVCFEIALSAVYRYMTKTPGQPYEGDTTPTKTRSGSIVDVPTLAFEFAPILADRIKKLVEEGGGAVNQAAIARASEIYARTTTGSVKTAADWNLPGVARGAERKQQILDHEGQNTRLKLKAMLARRRMLARFWIKNKTGFFKRGLAFTVDQTGFWKFNVDTHNENIDPVPGESTDEAQLQKLAIAVGRNAVAAFASAVNSEKHEVRYLNGSMDQIMVPEELSNEVMQRAAERLATRLRREMLKHLHGVVGLGVIERCLVLEWDPEDNKPLGDYPFPLAPSESAQDLDRWALDKLKARAQFFRKQGQVAARDDARPDAMPADLAGETKSWREDLDIEDWVPLEEPLEDDETIDRRAMEKADHAQSAALRRIRDESGGSSGKSKRENGSVIKHDIDYAGLPKDED